MRVSKKKKKEIPESVYTLDNYLIRNRYCYCGLSVMVSICMLPCLPTAAFQNLSYLIWSLPNCAKHLSISEAPTEHRAMRVGHGLCKEGREGTREPLIVLFHGLLVTAALPCFVKIETEARSKVVSFIEVAWTQAWCQKLKVLTIV